MLEATHTPITTLRLVTTPAGQGLSPAPALATARPTNFVPEIEALTAIVHGAACWGSCSTAAGCPA